MTNDQIDPQLGLGALPLGGDPEHIGRRRFLTGAGAAAGAGALATVVPAGFAQAASPDDASVFTPLAAAIRVADTRDLAVAVFTRVSDRHIRVKVKDRDGVPANASAVVLTATAVNFGEPNFVTVYPTGDALPVVSNLNMPRPAEATANLVTVKVGSNDSIDVYSRVPCDLIVDLLGFYTPVAGAARAGRFIGLASAARAIDTRDSFGFAQSGSFTWVDLTSHVPSHASSVVINLTATECTAPGYFTALPASASESTQPATSSLNVSYVGDTRASAVIVPVPTIGGKRRIKIYTLKAAKLIVDVTGYYTGDSSSLSTEGRFVPQSPVRILDTRLPGEIGKLWPGWVVERQVPGDAGTLGSAIVANVTGVESRGPGYLLVSAARRPMPPTSNVNWTIAGATVPNHVITPLTATHGVQVFSSHGAHVLVDLAGYFTGTPQDATLPAFTNPVPPIIGPPWVLKVPRMGLTSQVKDGDPHFVTDSGHSWHWTGTGFMGQEAHVALFAHRTEAGGPYLYLHTMVIGDTFTITTSDNRVYTYRMVGRGLVTGNSNAGPPPTAILAATRVYPGTTLSLIVCTKLNLLPTSLFHRLIVTGELIEWHEI